MPKPTIKKKHVHSVTAKGMFDVDLRLDFTDLEKGIQEAQYALDNQVMNDMAVNMPFVTGTFVDDTIEASTSVRGTGLVYAGVGPMGRFLYYGKTMVDPNTGSTWARHGQEKVLVSEYEGKTNAREDLQFASGVPLWFEVAKDEHFDDWVELVAKKIME